MKVNNKDTKKSHWRRFGVFNDNFVHISHFFLVFLLLIWECIYLLGLAFRVCIDWPSKTKINSSYLLLTVSYLSWKFHGLRVPLLKSRHLQQTSIPLASLDHSIFLACNLNYLKIKFSNELWERKCQSVFLSHKPQVGVSFFSRKNRIYFSGDRWVRSVQIGSLFCAVFYCNRTLRFNP